MPLEPEIFSTLMALECELHGPKARSDCTRLTELLHPDFQEFGRSGATYGRDDILARLVKEAQAVPVHAQDFKALELAPSVVLLTYRSAHTSASGQLERATNRSSIWRAASIGWQMIFHQGTPTEAFERRVD